MTKIKRRQVLKWCGGIAALPVFYPLVSSMVREAHGQTSLKPRYLQFCGSNGIWKKEFKPQFGGRPDASLLEGPLPRIFEPFEAHKDKLMIMSDFSCPFGLHLHGNGAGVFDMRAGPGGFGNGGLVYEVGGQTLDRLIGERLGSDTPVQSLNFVCWSKEGHLNFQNVSGDAYNQRFAADYRPVEAYDRMFAQAMNPEGPSAEELLEQKKSVLDFVARDIGQLESRLAGTERAKLQQFTESIRGLEAQLEGLSNVDCGMPTRPDPTLDSSVAQSVPDNSAGDGVPIGGSVVRREIADSFIELSVVALACNLTRSVNIMFDSGGAEAIYPFLGSSEVNMHTFAHEARAGEDPIDELPRFGERQVEGGRMMYKLWHYYGQQIVGLYDRLAEIPEGDGSLADSVLALWTSNSGGQHHNGNYEYPLILLGNPNGAFNSGRILDFGDGQNGRNDLDVPGVPSRHYLSDAYVTILHGLGIQESSFGDPQYFTGPLEGVLA